MLTLECHLRDRFAATKNIFRWESMPTGIKAKYALKLWGTSLFCLWAAEPS